MKDKKSIVIETARKLMIKCLTCGLNYDTDIDEECPDCRTEIEADDEIFDDDEKSDDRDVGSEDYGFYDD